MPSCIQCGAKLYDSARNKTGLCLSCWNLRRDASAHRCLDCKKKLTGAKGQRCQACYCKHVATPSRTCMDCGRVVSWMATRCRACLFKHRGRAKPHCQDCGVKLKVVGTLRCKPCWLRFLSTTGGIARMMASRALAMKNRTTRSKSEAQCAALLRVLKLRFREQVATGPFIVDFLLPSLNVIIEVHGGYWHDKPTHKQRDARKRKFLTSLGYRLIVLRQRDTHLWMQTLMKSFGWSCEPPAR